MQEITSLSQFNELKGTLLFIVDFYATWCGPCKVISPVFEKLSAPHTNSSTIIFAKLDVDKVKTVAQACGISAMPTFQFFRSGNKVDEVKGADVQQLTTKIGYYTAAVARESASESTSSSCKDPPATRGSLRALIDGTASTLLGTSNLSSIRNIVSPPPAGYTVASATGSSQFVMHISFRQTVVPNLIIVSAVKDSITNAPSRIQVVANVPLKTQMVEGVKSDDIDVESISKAENTQVFNIFSDDYVNGTAELKLKASKFGSVKSLAIRIDANISGDTATVTKVAQMDIIGIKS